MRLLVMCVAVLVLEGCGPRYAYLVQRELAAGDELRCGGYLVWNHEPVRDVFLVINGSGTLSNAFVHPSFRELLDEHGVAYSTYDKPGIRAPFGDPAEVSRDSASIQQYTLGHGVACATGALEWAREQFGASVRLHVRGHSEGTLVALYTYDALLDADPELAAQISTFVLSGLALEPFQDILDRQLAALPGGDRLREAFATCDWALLERSLGVSCAYVDDARQRPSGRALFERLAMRSSGARFYIFHGVQDTLTPVEPVRALETWNRAEGQLPIEFHYYEGEHAGSEAAREEVARLLDAIVSQGP
jgi:hypothetical protein